MKLIKRFVLVALLLLLLAGGAAFLMLDGIVRSAIEKGGSAATGTATTLDKADASFFKGAFGLDGFAIANPQGFRSEPFLALKSAHAQWQNGSILSDTLVIDEFALDGLALSLERSAAGNNWDKILDSLKKLSGPTPAKPAEPESGGSGRSVTIQKISILNTHCALHLSGQPALNGDWKVDVPAITILNLRSNGSTAEIAGKLTKAVVEAVVKQAASSGKGVFPADALKDLESGLKEVGQHALDDVLKGKTDPGAALKQAEKDAKGLFGGKKKP
jgi:uncharacterized protein involved in outer membrane biogenesis